MKSSVVMATYNGAEYLYEQLESIRTQTVSADEVLFFDDGSRDQTVSILEEYIAEHHLMDSWKVTVNEKNLGYANNFHKALMAAQGTYIFFADQDDVWCPDKIEDTLIQMEKHPEIMLLCSDFQVFTSADHAPTLSKRTLGSMTDDGSLEKIELSSRHFYIDSLGCVMCLRKTFRDASEPYWYNRWPHDDYVWKMAQCADGCYKYHRVLIKRRLHDHNVSMKKLHGYDNRMYYFQDVQKATAKMLQYGADHHFDSTKIRMLQRHLTSLKLRQQLVAEGKFSNSFRLLNYLDCYHSKKSVLMEPYLAFKFRSNRIS